MTRQEAIQISIELWTWLAETGRKKSYWPGWYEYDEMLYDCPLCEYADKGGLLDCHSCPYYQQFRFCDEDSTLYDKWKEVKTSKTRKKYAALFLEQLRQLK